jgi:hypothetical protein
MAENGYPIGITVAPAPTLQIESVLLPPMLTRHGWVRPILVAPVTAWPRAAGVRPRSQPAATGSTPGLSNHVRMSGPDESERQSRDAQDGASVLANLPRTRPQRSSARRAAARASRPTSAPAKAGAAEGASAPGAAAEPEASAPASSNGHAPTRTRDATPSARKRAPRTRSSTRKPGARATGAHTAPAAAPAPRQGFECEGERASRTVHPPGGAELVASVGEIVGELAKAGLSAGERLIKDAFSRLPL